MSLLLVITLALSLDQGVENNPPPPFSFFLTKATIDGVSRGNPSSTGCGHFSRNSKGFSKDCFSMLVGIETTFVTEDLAFIKTIELAELEKWFPLWVETDSMIL